MEFQKSLFIFFVFLACFLFSYSQAYKFYVGGRDGWVLNPKESYNHRTGRNRFQVNDTLYFKYKKGEDSVLVVKKDDYLKCKIENPIMKMEGGDSEFKFDRSGPFYFMTGNKHHCIKGQKLIVIVLAVRKTKPFPTPAPAPKTLPPFAQPPTTFQPPPPVALPPSPTSPSPIPLVPSPEIPTFSPTPTYVTPAPSTASPVVAPVPAVSPTAPSAVTPTPAANTPTLAPTPLTLTPSLSPASNPTEGSQGNTSSPTASPGSGTPADLTSPAPAPPKSSSFAVTPSSVMVFVVTVFMF
ncbi:early nodulin-like protein 2 [Tripterygium wilfordii]|uniref:early nodulin-like protein 2 n=1 Tax=Tripterygium wilfordii TaxID=458696 RepID=UPI0018F7F079|nr:early nodulin-like protein 2 [Tripterygium wilfordii]